MSLIDLVPTELWAPERVDDFIVWVKKSLPGQMNRPSRDYALKYWFQVNDMPYDGHKFRDILVED